jgi:hypothetical protein
MAFPSRRWSAQIWHEIFGQVTRDLARSGVTARAYGKDIRYKGSLSVL